MFTLSQRQTLHLHGLLCLSLVLGPTMASTANATDEPVVRDVTISGDGAVEFVVSDIAGEPLRGIITDVRHSGHRIAIAMTDAKGRVRITDVRPGVHTVTTPGEQFVCRFWTPGSAPPGAAKRPALVVSEDVARGQYYGPMMGYPMQPMMGPPMVAPVVLATGVTAAAVAVVLIGKNEGDDAVVIPASP